MYTLIIWCVFMYVNPKLHSLFIRSDLCLYVPLKLFHWSSPWRRETLCTEYWRWCFCISIYLSIYLYNMFEEAQIVIQRQLLYLQEITRSYWMINFSGYGSWTCRVQETLSVSLTQSFPFPFLFPLFRNYMKKLQWFFFCFSFLFWLFVGWKKQQ